MSLKQTITVFELLDSAKVNGQSIQTLFAPYASLGVKVTVTTVHDEAPQDTSKTTHRAARARAVLRAPWVWWAATAPSARVRPRSAWCPTPTAPSALSPPR